MRNRGLFDQSTLTRLIVLSMTLSTALVASCVLKFDIAEKDGSLDGEDTDGTIDGSDMDAPDEVNPSCGNGTVETDEGEECDDGRNGDDSDGCTDACRFTCAADADCRDGDICNGEESCDLPSHTCRPGTALEDGNVCVPEPRSICLGGACAASSCGDGFVDPGAGETCEPPGEGSCGSACRTLCDGDEDCLDDGDDCNGEEYCDMEEGMCGQRNPLGDGTVCSEDPRMICLGWTCQDSLCGDGFVDAEGGEECEDGNTTSRDGCENDCTFTCLSDPDCADTHVCTVDRCDLATHTCSNAIKIAGEPCRLAAGLCDTPEACDGMSPDCPADAFLPPDTVCRVAAGVCDAAENCTGDSGFCPVDAMAPTSTVCRESTTSCDPAEHCTGDSPTCPMDEYNCTCTSDDDCPDDGNLCNGDEYCNVPAGICGRQNPLPEGDLCLSTPRSICIGDLCTTSICGDGFTDAGAGEQCDDGNGISGDGCDTDCTYSCTSHSECTDSFSCTDDLCDPVLHRCTNLIMTAGSPCRASAGVCDVAEVCNGISPECPGDGFSPNTQVCRASAGDCDMEERCTGSSAACPSDAYHLSTTVCRPAAGTCDVEERCSGTSPTCPSNAYYPSSTVCRAAAGPCDEPELCSGTSASCPTNAFKPSSAECRASTLPCDPAEFCTGSAAACPADVSNCSCTGDGDCPDDGNLCNGEEYCNTTAGECQHRNPPAQGTVCGTSPRRICLGGLCQTSICGDSYTDPALGEECDDGNTVNGDGCDNDCTYSCHGDSECTDSYVCTTDRCDLVLHRCSNTIKSSTEVCRLAAGACDLVENCDGVNPTCPADAFRPSTYLCRPEAFECDEPEYCTGSSATCPADRGKEYSLQGPDNADSSSRQASHWPRDAIDGNVSSYWCAGSHSEPQWIYFDLGSVRCISGIRLFFRASEVPMTMDIQVSDTPSGWTTVVPGWVATTGGTWLEVLFDEAVTGRYVRLYVTSAIGYAHCNEAMVFEAAL